MTDEEIVVAMEDIGRQLRAVRAEFALRLRSRDKLVESILREVRESDECTASFGGCIPPGYECLTHTCALDPDDVDKVDRCGE